MTKTEQLIDDIQRIIRSNVTEQVDDKSGTYIIQLNEGDSSNQILATCQEAGLAFVVKDAKPPIPYTLTDALGVMNESYAQGAKKQREILHEAGWEKTEEIKIGK